MKTLKGTIAVMALVAMTVASAMAQNNNAPANPAPAPGNARTFASPGSSTGTAGRQPNVPPQPPRPRNPHKRPHQPHHLPRFPPRHRSPSPPVTPVADGEKGLRLNFRGAPLEMVLNYLSDAAGFIIVLEAKPEGKVDVWSNQPLTKDEAVDFEQILNKNNLAAIRNGRTLTMSAGRMQRRGIFQ